MRVGSFKLLNVWERGVNYRRIVPADDPGQYRQFLDYELFTSVGVEYLFKFLLAHRQPGDPDPLEIMSKMFPKERRQFEDWVAETCKRNLLESNDGDDYPHPF